MYSKMQDTLSEISHAVSLPRLEVYEGVERLVKENERLSLEYKKMRMASFEREANAISPTEGNLVLTFADASYDELRTVANGAKDKVGGILVLLSGADESYKFICASRSVDLRAQMPKINTALNGKGGGNCSMVQGSFSSSLQKIEEYFN